MFNEIGSTRLQVAFGRHQTNCSKSFQRVSGKFHQFFNRPWISVKSIGILMYMYQELEESNFPITSRKSRNDRFVHGVFISLRAPARLTNSRRARAGVSTGQPGNLRLPGRAPRRPAVRRVRRAAGFTEGRSASSAGRGLLARQTQRPRHAAARPRHAAARTRQLALGFIFFKKTRFTPVNDQKALLKK